MDKTRDTSAATAAAAKKKREATHCQRGHAWTPENTLTRKDGRRNCKICTYDRLWYRRRGMKLI